MNWFISSLIFFFLSRDQLAYTCVLIVLQCIIVTSCVIGLEGPVKTKLCVVVLVACRGNRQWDMLKIWHKLHHMNLTQWDVVCILKWRDCSQLQTTQSFQPFSEVWMGCQILCFPLKSLVPNCSPCGFVSDADGPCKFLDGKFCTLKSGSLHLFFAVWKLETSSRETGLENGVNGGPPAPHCFQGNPLLLWCCVPLH